MQPICSDRPDLFSVSAHNRGLWPSLALGGILTLFLAVRVPVIYLQPGGQDEDQYSIPGLTVLDSGIPRLPNIPARNAESVFYQADLALFAQLPLYFYWQALFYAILPDMYGTARLSSVFAGLAALIAVNWIGQRLSGRASVGLAAAALFSVSRWFYFPATTARPDQLCCTFGLLAMAALLHSRTSPRRSFWLMLSGLSIGCGGLTHMFAITYAVPLGLWAAVDEGEWRRRLRSFAIISGSAIAVAMLWIPLIVSYPEPFRRQFYNQFVSGTGDSLLARILTPANSLQYQGAGMLQHIGWPQMILVTGAFVVGMAFSLRRRQWEWIALLLTAAISAAGVVLILGDHHQGYGYWGVPAGLLYIAVGSLPARLSAREGLTAGARHGFGIAAFALLALAHVPGCGLRTLFIHWQHRGEVEYNAPRFAQLLMRDIPLDARCSVDAQFMLDFYVSGRPTVNLQSMPMYFLTQDYPYDFMIVSRFGMAEGTAELAHGEFVRSYGFKDDPFACYAEIYRPAEATKQDSTRTTGGPRR